MYCKSCNVKVETHTNVCPLCKRNLIDDDTLEEDSGSSAKADFTIVLGKDFDGRIVR